MAGKLLANPAMLHLARDNIRRRQAVGGNSPALNEWEDILKRSAAQVADFFGEC